MNRGIRGHLAVMLAGLIANGAYGRTYVVQPGDTLSQISQRELGGPVWGSKGTLKKVQSLNPQVKNLDRIYPKDVIILSDEPVADQSEPTPVPEPEPAPVPAASAEGDAANSVLNSQHRFRILGIVGDTEIKGRDDDNRFATTLHSKTNTGFAVGWDYRLSATTSVGLSASVIQSQFASTADGRFKGVEHSLAGFGANVAYDFAPQWHTVFSIGVQQFYFLTENTATALVLEPVFVDNGGLSVAYDILNGSSLISGLEIHATYALPANASNFDVHSGFTYGTMVYGKYPLSASSAVIGDIFYDRRVQSTSGTMQRNGDSGIKLGMQFDL